MRVFVDADWFLDSILKRFQGGKGSEEFWVALQRRQISGYITTNGLGKIYQHTCNFAGEIIADRILSEIQAIVEVCPIDNYISLIAHSLPIQDYESAVEVACAIHGNFGAIVTDRPQDFEGATLHILSVDEALRRMQLEQAARGLFSVNLSHWLQGNRDSSWRPAEQILNPRQMSFNFRRSAPPPGLGKLLDIGFSKQIALVVRLTPAGESSVDIWVEVWVSGDEIYLPQNLEIALLDQVGDVAMYARPRGDEENIRLNFTAERGELFYLRVISGSTFITETFTL
jgi:hypothetical protein